MKYDCYHYSKKFLFFVCGHVQVGLLFTTQFWTKEGKQKSQQIPVPWHC